MFPGCVLISTVTGEAGLDKGQQTVKLCNFSKWCFQGDSTGILSAINLYPSFTGRARGCRC